MLLNVAQAVQELQSHMHIDYEQQTSFIKLKYIKIDRNKERKI